MTTARDLYAQTVQTEFLGFSDLTDVDTAGVVTGQTMTWNGTAWVPAPSREVLTADRTYYVRTDGNDSNNGLTNTAGGAFLTIQKAIDIAAMLDASIYDVTIQFTGTYTLTNSIVIKKPIGSGQLILDGLDNTATTIISASTNTIGYGLIVCSNWQNVRLKNFKTSMSKKGLWGVHILAEDGAKVFLENLDFGDLPNEPAQTSHVFADTNAVISFAGNYKISGGRNQGGGTNPQGYHLRARNGGIVASSSLTATITNTPNFVSFVDAESKGIVQSYMDVFSGAVATGCKRYNGSLNAIVNQFGLGATYPFPGSVAGTVATGAQYT